MRHPEADVLENATWIKSRHSKETGCVEVAFVGGGAYIAVRNSQLPDGAVLVFGRDEWFAFLNGTVDGEFDPPE